MMTDFNACLGTGTIVLGLTATYVGFKKSTSGNSWKETASGICLLVSGAVAGTAGYVILSHSQWMQDSFSNLSNMLPSVFDDSAHVLKANKAIGEGSVKACTAALRELPNHSAAKQIAYALGTSKVFCSLPKIDGNHVLRLGPYLHIKPEDMTAPVMRGLDSANRPLVGLHTEGKMKDQVHDNVEILHQKYTYNPMTWISSGEATPRIVGDNPNVVREGDLLLSRTVVDTAIDRIRSVLNHQTINGTLGGTIELFRQSGSKP